MYIRTNSMATNHINNAYIEYYKENANWNENKQLSISFFENIKITIILLACF